MVFLPESRSPYLGASLNLETCIFTIENFGKTFNPALKNAKMAKASFKAGGLGKLSLNIDNLELANQTEISLISQKYRGVKVFVSGGPDSTALLHALFELAKRQKIFLAGAIHFNYKLRGQESEEDQKFIEKLCNDLNVPLKVIVATREKPTSSSKNVQLWARRERRLEMRRQIADGWVVSVGHTMDDQAETLLMRLSRGTGLAGAAAMRRFSTGIWRPFLGVKKVEILEWCAQSKWEYRIDSSNRKSYYRRNAIRNEVLPKLERAFPGASENLVSFARDAADLANWISGALEPLVVQLTSESGVGLADIRSMNRGTFAYFLRAAYRRVRGNGGAASILGDTVGAIWDAMRKDALVVRQWSLSPLVGFRVERERCYLRVTSDAFDHPRALQSGSSLGPQMMEVFLGAGSCAKLELSVRSGFIAVSNTGRDSGTFRVRVVMPNMAIAFWPQQSNRRKTWRGKELMKLTGGDSELWILGDPERALAVFDGRELSIFSDQGEKIAYCGEWLIRLEC